MTYFEIHRAEGFFYISGNAWERPYYADGRIPVLNKEEVLDHLLHSTCRDDDQLTGEYSLVWEVLEETPSKVDALVKAVGYAIDDRIDYLHLPNVYTEAKHLSYSDMTEVSASVIWVVQVDLDDEGCSPDFSIVHIFANDLTLERSVLNA